jgi:PII-like signaling protein
VSKDALKLTTYFGERSRLRGRLLADELLDIHARHKIRSSVLLRGIQGFGAKHRRRTDRLLTLSEDLPLVSVAIDTRERIDALLGDVAAIGHEGLLTLERARLHGIEMESIDLHQSAGEAIKLTVYTGRHERVGGTPAFTAVCRMLQDAGVAGATVLLGVDGTRDGQRRRARFFAGNANVPMMVMAIGDPPQIGEALAHLKQALSKPLFTTERVRLCKRDGQLMQTPHDQSGSDHGMAVRQKLTIVVSEATLHESKPVHQELVRRLRVAHAAGATSLRGIWGFHGNHAPHGDRLLSIRRHVPVITDIIDTPKRIAALFDIVDELTRERGLVTSEMVPTTSTLHAESHDMTPQDT